jgi:hypothetical protein
MESRGKRARLRLTTAGLTAVSSGYRDITGRVLINRRPTAKNSDLHRNCFRNRAVGQASPFRVAQQASALKRRSGPSSLVRGVPALEILTRLNPPVVQSSVWSVSYFLSFQVWRGS